MIILLMSLQDDVFVNVVASVHFQILDVADVNNAKKAFYVHSDPEQLIKAHAFNGQCLTSSFL